MHSVDELTSIFLSLAEKSEYNCNDDVRASLNEIIARAVMNGDRTFGNARFVRNLFESTIERQAVRLSSVASLTNEMLQEIALCDLQP